MIRLAELIMYYRRTSAKRSPCRPVDSFPGCVQRHYDRSTRILQAWLRRKADAPICPDMIHVAWPLRRAADEQHHADTIVHSMPWGRGGRPDTPIVSNPRPMLRFRRPKRLASARRLTIQFTYHYCARSDYRKVRSGRPRTRFAGDHALHSRGNALVQRP